MWQCCVFIWSTAKTDRKRARGRGREGKKEVGVCVQPNLSQWLLPFLLLGVLALFDLNLSVYSCQNSHSSFSHTPSIVRNAVVYRGLLASLQEALQQLEELSHGWPKEPNIYISKGKVGYLTLVCHY